MSLRRLFRRAHLARKGIYQLTDDERAGIEKGLEDMRAGRFATDEQIDASFGRRDHSAHEKCAAAIVLASPHQNFASAQRSGDLRWRSRQNRT
jgi:hypothetical protein